MPKRSGGGGVQEGKLTPNVTNAESRIQVVCSMSYAVYCVPMV